MAGRQLGRCPAASCSGSCWPARWPRRRPCCSSTSRRAPWTSAAGSRPRAGRRAPPGAGADRLSAMHDLTLAGQFADRLLLLADGRMAASGPPPRCCARRCWQAFRAAVQVITTDTGDVAVISRRPPRDTAPVEPADGRRCPARKKKKKGGGGGKKKKKKKNGRATPLTTPTAALPAADAADRRSRRGSSASRPASRTRRGSAAPPGTESRRAARPRPQRSGRARRTSFRCSSVIFRPRCTSMRWANPQLAG